MLLADPRFESIQKSSLYHRPSNRKTQVVVDKRFAPMLTDERFSSKAKVDRYGRKLRGRVKDSNVELNKLYRVEVEEERKEKDVPDSDAVVQAELWRVAKKYGDVGYDPARDGGFSESSSSEEDSDSDEIDDQSVESDMEEDKVEAVPEGEISRRLAVVNLDWDHVRAVDLLAAFSSYASTGSASDIVEKVTIYPSEFGKERMEREEVEGPPKELFASQKPSREVGEESAVSTDEEISDEDTDEDEDERIRKSLVKEDNGKEVSSTKLRNYQLERLRYFYAVVTCSNPSVAKEIYDNVDGREYLSSANFFDLRFIPDGMEFQEDKPRDECSRIPSNYRPNEFITAALQHSKVKLTWDAEDSQRKEIQQRAFGGSRKDIDENELRAYLASDHSSSEDEQGVDMVDSTIGTTSELVNNPGPSSKSESKRQQLRAKLGLGDEPKASETNHIPVGGMKVTFTPGLSATEKQASVFENVPEIEETTAEKYVRKERERKARRKEKAKAQRSDVTQTHADSASAEGAGELQQDAQGFDDPFFTATPASAEAQAKKQKQKKKLKQRQHAAEQEASTTAAATNDIAELERILQQQPNTTTNTSSASASHFSLSALEKAERALKKQKLKRGSRFLSQSEKAALEAKAKDGFEMDLADERFTAVYERPEFALDPSHPRFRETEGMQTLLQEARQRRKRKLDAEEEE